ncbi:MAG TPA: electron transport complex subunit E [Candidatus Hydrogenedentes bacterium]|nr:electron transport complex subunit E [Candidatus Hydrogenedentota bacterium]HQH52331.1 electron transport complex subunit E [Candidatus Hydrogenedentota bacterium]HQM47433.1 electron transport complex subunit E [Candidatus Hydrogenedentota bacterium]
MAQGNPATTMDEFMKGLWRENPVFVMLIGMCPTMAVSNTVINSLAMGACAIFVLVMSSAVVSLIRKLVPKEVRIATFIVVIATLVTIVDYVMQYISLPLYQALGVFIPLIVVNCIILARAEVFASRNNVWLSSVDALGMGVGFTFALLCLGTVREIIGKGAILGIPLFGPNFEPWSVMVLPPGGFFTLGSWLLFFNWLRERRARKLKKAE